MTASRLALVTGASSGIGLELARLFARDGYDLVIAADDDAIVAAAAELAESNDVAVRPVQADLAYPDQIEHLYRSAAEGGRRIHAAALNAGIGRAGAFVGGDLDADLRIIDLNVRATVHLAKLVLDAMVEDGGGRVLFTSSLVATMPGSNQSMYNASKAFIQSFAEALHDELRGTPVTVTALMPGPTDTDFFRRNGMLNTPLGQLPFKDDPADTAKAGYEAMLAGRPKVVASSLMSRLTGVVNSVLPDSAKAVANRMLAAPFGNR